jgi:hypothetical protein
MAVIAAEDELFRRAGRNDPCPCGSGKKTKQCHGSPANARPAGTLPESTGAPRPPVTERGRRAAARSASRAATIYDPEHGNGGPG